MRIEGACVDAGQMNSQQWPFLLSLCFSQGIGTDEDTLIEILASRNNREILDIKKAYKEGEVPAQFEQQALSCCLEHSVWRITDFQYFEHNFKTFVLIL